MFLLFPVSENSFYTKNVIKSVDVKLIFKYFLKMGQ